MRDRYERRHRRTARHPECVAVMAGANFAGPSLAEAIGLEDKTVKIWLCEDIGGDGPPCHGYGETQADAEAYVSGNRGYDDYDGSEFAGCVADGWAKPAVQIEVPDAVAATLLASCKI